MGLAHLFRIVVGVALLGTAAAHAQGFTTRLDLGPARDAPVVGVTEKVVRDAFGGGRAYRLQEQERIRFREQIDTLAQSGTSFRFVDGTTLSVGENAAFRLDEFVFDPGRGMLQGGINLTKGALRFVGSTQKKDVTIATPSATLGVRGTVFNLRSAAEATELEVVSGEVAMQSGSTIQTIRAGEFARAAGGTIQRGAAPAAFRAAMGQIEQALGTSAAAAATPAAGTAELRNAAGVVVGYTRTRPDGRIDALDAGRRLIGWFDPASNATYAWNGRRLAAGNRAAALAQGEPR
jgi:hypothetical protein